MFARRWNRFSEWQKKIAADFSIWDGVRVTFRGWATDVRGHCKRNWWQKVEKGVAGQRADLVRQSLGLILCSIECKVNIQAGLQIYPGLNWYGPTLSVNKGIFVKGPRAAICVRLRVCACEKDWLILLFPQVCNHTHCSPHYIFKKTFLSFN